VTFVVLGQSTAVDQDAIERKLVVGRRVGLALRGGLRQFENPPYRKSLRLRSVVVRGVSRSLKEKPVDQNRGTSLIEPVKRR
jgi:hypothetical protein